MCTLAVFLGTQSGMRVSTLESSKRFQILEAGSLCAMRQSLPQGPARCQPPPAVGIVRSLVLLLGGGPRKGWWQMEIYYLSPPWMQSSWYPGKIIAPILESPSRLCHQGVCGVLLIKVVGSISFLAQVTSLFETRNGKGCCRLKAEPKNWDKLSSSSALPASWICGFLQLPSPSSSCGWLGSAWETQGGPGIEMFVAGFGPDQWRLVKSGVKPDWLQLGRCTTCIWCVHHTVLSHQMSGWVGYFSFGTRHVKIIYRFRKVPSQLWTLARWYCPQVLYTELLHFLLFF